MRVLCLLLVLSIAPSVAAAPIQINTVSLYTFDVDIPGTGSGCGGITATCVGLDYNLLSGAGTVSLDLLNSVNDPVPVERSGAADAMLGFAGIGMGADLPPGLFPSIVRVTLTGDLLFDYFAVSLYRTATTMQVISVGTMPLFPPHIVPLDPIVQPVPEPAAVALLLAGAAMWLVARGRGRHLHQGRPVEP